MQENKEKSYGSSRKMFSRKTCNTENKDAEFSLNGPTDQVNSMNAANGVFFAGTQVQDLDTL
ncbi:hypothetical protein TorRG33x02_134580 [Trema orientale]|uniref:Uncharacterized protein n=1 Tax=Trema orientale TaxID=63057 RepID=A0A2P5EZ61_TREOI|nr:hypothetical protein TorRG33x02_134580 [Trema orientale]